MIDELTLSIKLKFDLQSINIYNDMKSSNSLSYILDQLKNELSSFIPLNPSRLRINNKIQDVNTVTNEKQVLLSVTIFPPINSNGIERNTESVKNDLIELIKEKKVSLISQGNITKFLDENYESQIIRKYIN